MDNAGYTQLTRQSGLLRELQVIANNIANISTTGFRREGIVFSEFVRRLDRQEDTLSMAAANANIDLVKNQRRYAGRLTGHHLDGKTDPRQLAAGGDPGQRARFAARQPGNAEFDLFEPGRSTAFDRQQRDFETPAAECQLLHHLADFAAKRRGGFGTPGRQASGELVISLSGSFDALGQAGEVGSITELGQSFLPARQQGRQLIRSAARLACAIQNGFDATLDVCQTLRIEFDPVGVTAQGRHRLAEFRLRRLQE